MKHVYKNQEKRIHSGLFRVETNSSSNWMLSDTVPSFPDWRIVKMTAEALDTNKKLLPKDFKSGGIYRTSFEGVPPTFYVARILGTKEKTVLFHTLKSYLNGGGALWWLGEEGILRGVKTKVEPFAASTFKYTGQKLNTKRE